MSLFFLQRLNTAVKAAVPWGKSDLTHLNLTLIDLGLGTKCLETHYYHLLNNDALTDLLIYHYASSMWGLTATPARWQQ